MTSSLVGSEMCIRDRARVLRLASKECLVAVSTPRALTALTKAGHCCLTGCLLYTSDAADDM
eukprot:6288443-Prorocentrum_lima.AAC.1